MRKFNIKAITLFLVWITLAIIFAICDLQISSLIVDKNSVWAGFLEKFGMIPGLLVIISGIYIYYSSINQKSDAWAYIQKVVFFLTCTGLILYLFDIIISNIISKNFVINHLINSLIITFTLNIIIFILLQIMQPVKNSTTVMYARFVVGMALFGYVVCIQGVKYFWGRVRFRELDAAFSHFTPWYLPQGLTGFDSFPSGHAAMGWMLLALLVLFADKKRWLKHLVFIIIFLWGVILALSRVVIGAHYASDVLFGSFFIIITYLLIRKHCTNQT